MTTTLITNLLNQNQWTGTIQVETIGTKTQLHLTVPTITVDITELDDIAHETSVQVWRTPSHEQILGLLNSVAYEIADQWEEDFTYRVTKTRAWSNFINSFDV